MTKEINESISSCSTCAQSKLPRHLPAEKLLPHENLLRPWSNISVDFLVMISRRVISPNQKTTPPS